MENEKEKNPKNHPEFEEFCYYIGQIPGNITKTGAEYLKNRFEYWLKTGE